MVLKKEKGTTIVTTVMSVILFSRWPRKRKKYHDCYNCDVGCIVCKMALKKEKGTTIVTTVMSVILCSRWP